MMRTILMATLVTLSLPSDALADRRSAPLASHAMISNGDANRLLFKAPGLRMLSTVAVRHARIEFDVAGAATGRSLHLSLCPVTTEWDASSVNWNTGWSRPGGDFDEDLGAEIAVDLSRDTRRAYFDVTPILKEWLEHGMEFDGFILTVQAREGGEGIRSADLSRFQNLTTASLVVDYRRVPPGPPRRNRG